MKDWDDLLDELEGLTDEELEALQEELEGELEGSGVEFELQFYAHVCDSEDFHVLAIPDSDGHIPDSSDLNKVRRQVALLGSNLVYRVSHGKFATVYSPKTGKVGVVPENNPDGFSC